MRKAFFPFVLILAVVALGFLIFSRNTYTFNIANKTLIVDGKENASQPSGIAPVVVEIPKPLANPPKIIKAVYATSWTVSGPVGRKRMIDLIKATELNAIVFDVKDFSGKVLYNTNLKEIVNAGAKEARIASLENTVKEFHDAGIYVIARMPVFQDQVIIKTHPEWAVLDSSTGVAWKDRKGLGWADAGCKGVWDYNVAIAKEVAARGVDEINFDYIRFPSDGNMKTMQFQCYDATQMTKHEQMRGFFAYLDSSLRGTRISGDLFGLVTSIYDGDLGIGQTIEDAYPYFDYVAPMVYPSHYAVGFLGFKNPADHPYEIVFDAAMRATERQNAVEKQVRAGELRPWLQDFDLGADYTAPMVRAQMDAITAGWKAVCKADAKARATKDANANNTSETPLFATPTAIAKMETELQCDKTDDESAYYAERINGWMLWDPKNIYTPAALKPAIE